MTHTFSMLLRRCAFAAAALIIGLSAPNAAYALDLDGARTQGLVGERADGLIGPVSNTPDVAALVQAINGARMAKYQEIAAKEGTKVDAVQAIAGAKQVQKARESGWFYMDQSGAWKKN